MDQARNPDFAQRLFEGLPEPRLALMRAAWPAAVGADVARRTAVVAIDRGVLRIKVPDPGWQRRSTIAGGPARSTFSTSPASSTASTSSESAVSNTSSAA